MKSMKKLLAGALALTMLVGTVAFAADSPAAPKKEAETKSNVVADGGAKVDTNADGTVAVKEIKSSKKTVTVASTMTVNGVSYKVTTIAGNAFKNCKKATTISLPATVKTIKKNAFKGCTKLKTIKINIKKKITVKSGAFKGLKTKKMTIKVAKGTKKADLKKIQQAFKKAGFKGKVTK